MKHKITAGSTLAVILPAGAGFLRANTVYFGNAVTNGSMQKLSKAALAIGRMTL